MREVQTGKQNLCIENDQKDHLSNPLKPWKYINMYIHVRKPLNFKH